jgi:hypothetical protein
MFAVVGVGFGGALEWLVGCYYCLVLGGGDRVFDVLE